MTHDTASLLATLVADADPVRRLAPPWRRAGLYLSFAAAVLAGLALLRGVRPDLAAQFGSVDFLLATSSALLTGVTGVLAALLLAAPDRTRLWIALPLASAALWLGAVGLGCLRGWVALEPGALDPAELASCSLTVVLAGTPLTLAMLALLRRAAPLRPALPLAAAALAAAGITATALGLLHSIGASALVLAWTAGIIGLALLAHGLAARLVRPA